MRYYLILPFILFPLTVSAAGSITDRLSAAGKTYRECFDNLPAKIRRQIADPADRGRMSWSQDQQDRVEACLIKERELNDLKDTIRLRDDLVNLFSDVSGTLGSGIGAEAEDIASRLVKTTTSLNSRYRMGRAALWHNFLIWLGVKEGGYCYQWADELLRVFPQSPYAHFERHWGVHNKDKPTENNAVIITGRGQPLDSGIVYDPWRGKGSPFWRYISKDDQDWTELIPESRILAGQM